MQIEIVGNASSVLNLGENGQKDSMRVRRGNERGEPNEEWAEVEGCETGFFQVGCGVFHQEVAQELRDFLGTRVPR